VIRGVLVVPSPLSGCRLVAAANLRCAGWEACGNQRPPEEKPMRLLLTFITAAAIALAADAPSANPLSTETKNAWNGIKGLVLRAAEKMPEEHYPFKAAPDVRTYGAIVAHIADAHYLLCAPVRGDKKELAELVVEKTVTGKAALIGALKESIAYCDAAYDAMTDAKAAETAKFFNRDRARLGILNSNVSHDWEHYGNLVTYLRIKGIVPPSSERRQ
jgi:hypothetical protein